MVNFFLQLEYNGVIFDDFSSEKMNFKVEVHGSIFYSMNYILVNPSDFNQKVIKSTIIKYL